MGRLSVSSCDSKGRLYLKRALRSRHGTKFFIVEHARTILLFPIPDDPVKDLELVGVKLKGKSLQELRAAIRKRARREVLE